MEELQDAIEDAQYVSAISTQEDGPRPVIPWPPAPERTDVAFHESPIALFLFASYVKERHDDYTRLNFCEDVYRVRQRKLPIYKILRHFESEAPPRTEIDELDLSCDKQLEPIESELSVLNMDYPLCSESRLGLKGPVLKDLQEALDREETDLSILDTAEALVRQSLLDQYWPLFVTSDEYRKLQDFIWYQRVRPMVPEDFYVLRVLGRGGFGLVTGA